MYKSAKHGWYRVLNDSKFISQMQESKTVMKSTRIVEGFLEINYKSGLELKCLRYCDMNIHIKKYSLEPFAVKYLSPKDGKIHRYFIDFFIEFSNGQKFLVEVKSSGETREPKMPGKKTEKALLNYQKALQTYAVNKSKWSAATQFCKEKGLTFIILTEKELK
jgi:hypothetical protein